MINNTLSSELASFESDFQYYQKEKENLRKRFLNKFVAIKDHKIIDSGDSIEEIRDRLEKNNIDASKVVIEFVPEEETIMVL